MAEKTCPMFMGECVEHRCRWYIQILGNNPQTGAPLKNDGWGCAVEWLPVLLIEGSKETRQAAAAIESARNEARKDADGLGHSLLQLAGAIQQQRAHQAPTLTAADATPPQQPLSFGRRLLRLVSKNGD